MADDSRHPASPRRLTDAWARFVESTSPPADDFQQALEQATRVLGGVPDTLRGTAYPAVGTAQPAGKLPTDLHQGSIEGPKPPPPNPPQQFNPRHLNQPSPYRSVQPSGGKSDRVWGEGEDFEPHNPFHRAKLIRESPFNLSVKGVMRVVLDHLDNKTLKCWPSQSTIARESGASERQVRDVLAAMKQLGLLEWEQRRHPSQQRRDLTTNLYSFPWKRWVGLQPSDIPESHRRWLAASQRL